MEKRERYRWREGERERERKRERERGRERDIESEREQEIEKERKKTRVKRVKGCENRLKKDPLYHKDRWGCGPSATDLSLSHTHIGTVWTQQIVALICESDFRDSALYPNN